MDNLTNFDKLIINLASDEKKELLEKMEMTFELSQDPLVEQEELIESDFKNFQADYESLNVIQKILIFIQSLVKQKDIPSLLKEHKVQTLRKKYFKDSDLADFKNSLLRQSFYDEIVKLKDPCRFFRNYLQKIFSFDNKQDFYAFIGGIVLPDLQQKLLVKTNPWEIEKKDLDQEVGSIKSEIDSFLDLEMDSVSDLDKTIMNEACQSLFSLYLLSTFELSVITGSFDRVTTESGKFCLIHDVQDSLLELSGILQSLNKPPTIRAMEALFLYSIESNSLKEELNKKMTVSDTFLSTIRDFNRKVPLENLVKVLSGDLTKSSRKPPVVEDWFRIYRKFWSSRVNEKYAYYVNERKKNESEKYISSLLGIRYIKPIEKYSRDYYFDGSPAKFEKSVAFLRTLAVDILPNKISPILNIIEIEGEFYKKDNKTEFKKVLTYFDILNKKISYISHMITSDKILGEKNSETVEKNEEEKCQDIIIAMEKIDLEIDTMISLFIDHIKIFNKIMHGIVIGNGGTYDTLSNISSIGGKENTELRETLKLTSLMISKIEKYIIEMKMLEEKKM